MFFQEWGQISKEESNKRALWLGHQASELVESAGSLASKAGKLRKLVELANNDLGILTKIQF